LTTIEKYLDRELEDLALLFAEKFPEYGTSWMQRSADWLLMRLQFEVYELASLILENSCSTHKQSEKRKEALDIANLALMIANNHVLPLSWERREINVSQGEKE